MVDKRQAFRVLGSGPKVSSSNLRNLARTPRDRILMVTHAARRIVNGTDPAFGHHLAHAPVSSVAQTVSCKIVSVSSNCSRSWVNVVWSSNPLVRLSNGKVGEIIVGTSTGPQKANVVPAKHIKSIFMPVRLP